MSEDGISLEAIKERAKNVDPFSLHPDSIVAGYFSKELMNQIMIRGKRALNNIDTVLVGEQGDADWRAWQDSEVDEDPKAMVLCESDKSVWVVSIKKEDIPSRTVYAYDSEVGLDSLIVAEF